MFCSNCGSTLDGEFCSNCGAGKSGGTRSTNGARQKFGFKVAAVAVAAVAVLIAVVFGVVSLGSTGDAGQSTASNTDAETHSTSEYAIVEEFFTQLSAETDVCFSQGAFKSVATSYFTEAGFTYEEVSSEEMKAAIALVYKDSC